MARQQMSAVQARIPAEQVAWLSLQAAENGTSVSEEIRQAIWLRMVHHGDLDAQHIDDSAMSDELRAELEQALSERLAHDAEPES